MDDRFDLGDFLLRAAFACALVLLTFNPSGYSYTHMVADGFPRITPLEAVCGILLLIGWLVYLNATFKAIGVLGMLLAGALFAALIWLMTSWGWFTLTDTRLILWLGLFVLALILAVGMSWSHLYRRWSGQAIVDDVDEAK
jgi:hypothetical protein